MKIKTTVRFVFACSVILFLSGSSSTLHAQGPEGKEFGFGLILGEPTGGTIKYWVNPENALVADIGYSYFGAPRIDLDYVWHFHAFNSNVVKLYGALGGAVGFGNGYYGVFYKRGKYYVISDDAPFYYRSYYNSDVGFGVRAMFGLNIIPRRTPLELFLEAGPLIGISPFGVAFDLAVGVRFYP